MKRAIFIIDIAVFCLAYLLAYFLRDSLIFSFSRQINPLTDYLDAFVFIFPLWLLAQRIFNPSDSIVHRNFYTRYLALLKQTTLGVAVFIVIGFFFRRYELGRSVVILFGVLHAPLLLICHGIFQRYYSHRLTERAIIVGTNENGARFLQRIEDAMGNSIATIGYVSENDTKDTFCAKPVFGTTEELVHLVRTLAVDVVFLALPSLEKDDLFAIIDRDYGRKVTFKILSDAYSLLSQSLRVDMVADLPLITFQKEGPDPVYLGLKYCFDLFAALLGLVLVAPLMIVVAILIRMDSRGPVIIKQRRIGKNNRPFVLYKFRTMTSDTDLYADSPVSSSDRRITTIGHYLRTYSLDELPQLFNVLKGEMSLVGPRPEMPYIVEQYKGWELLRLRVKPGITGLWQILGRKDLPLQRNLEYDLYYIKNKSLTLDLVILLKTIPALLFRKGAY